MVDMMTDLDSSEYLVIIHKEKERTIDSPDVSNNILRDDLEKFLITFSYKKSPRTHWSFFSIFPRCHHIEITGFIRDVREFEVEHTISSVS